MADIKGKIDKNGALWMNRGGRLTNMICPWRNDGISGECRVSCPLLDMHKHPGMAEDIPGRVVVSFLCAPQSAVFECVADEFVDEWGTGEGQD